MLHDLYVFEVKARVEGSNRAPRLLDHMTWPNNNPARFPFCPVAFRCLHSNTLLPCQSCHAAALLPCDIQFSSHVDA